MPYVMVTQSMMIILLQKTLFRGLRAQNTFMRLYDFVSAILAPLENEVSKKAGPYGNVLDQRQLMFNYSYFLTELKNSFTFKGKFIRYSSIILSLCVGFIIFNTVILHMLNVTTR